MNYLEEKRRNARLSVLEGVELLRLINAALDAANAYTKALHVDGYEAELEAASEADDDAYRAVLAWLCAHTVPETDEPTSATDTGTGSGVPS